MIKVRAKILLYSSSDGGRLTPFKSGYRPLFNFIKESKTSGQIDLLNKPELFPGGEEEEVEIKFLDKKYLENNFGKGTKFTFDEGRQLLGQGEIMHMLKEI